MKFPGAGHASGRRSPLPADPSRNHPPRPAPGIPTGTGLWNTPSNRGPVPPNPTAT